MEIGNVILAVGAILLLLLLVGGGTYQVIKDYQMTQNDCLTKIAKDFCSSKGEKYNGKIINKEFVCESFTNRQTLKQRYEFSEKELEMCLE